MFLTAAGCQVRATYGGEQALAELRTFDPDVVLVDLGMPGLNGLDVCRRIRSLPHGDAMLVVALTGWGQEESRRRTKLAGFDAHVVKPVEPSTLLELIASARHAGDKNAGADE
jgi:CheY-like chemotaxis protein